VWDWLPCVLSHLGLSAVLVAASAVVLRRTSRRAGDGRLTAPAGPPEASAEHQAPPALPAAPPSDQPTPTARPAAPAREVSDQPVLWRETRRPLMAKPWQAVVGAAATVVLLLVTYFVLWGDHLLDEEMTQAGYAWVFNMIVWLLASVLAATAIAQEKESDTWTLLLTTPLTGRAIVWGKVLGVYKRLAWLAALILTHFLAFTLFGVITWQALLVTVWVIFTFNSIWVASGVYLSLRHRKVTVAVIVNLLLAVVIYLVAFFVLLTAGEMTGGHDLQELVAWYLPYFYLADGITATWSGHSDSVYLPGNWRVSGETFLTVVFVVGVVHLAVSYGILRVTAGSFDRIVGRARQRRETGALRPAPGV
jgi:ABC-type transport system involved in multi-copper enzyme maturation permease subunit